MPDGIPVPHGKPVKDSLRVEGGGTRDTDEVTSDELDVGVGVNDKLELAEGVGLGVTEKDSDRLDNISSGISSLPSSSSNESGARVHCGASEEVDCSLSPSSSSRESGARVHEGPSDDVGCSLSPSSSSSDSGARVQLGPSVVRGGCSLSPSSLLRSSGARVHIGASLLEVVVNLLRVVVVDVPRIPQPVYVARRGVQHVDVTVVESVKLIDWMVVGSNWILSVQWTSFSVTVVFLSSSHFGGRLVLGLGLGPGLGPQPVAMGH